MLMFFDNTLTTQLPFSYFRFTFVTYSGRQRTRHGFSYDADAAYDG